jgi:hypothetical protein
MFDGMFWSWWIPQCSTGGLAASDRTGGKTAGATLQLDFPVEALRPALRIIECHNARPL